MRKHRLCIVLKKLIWFLGVEEKIWYLFCVTTEMWSSVQEWWFRTCSSAWLLYSWYSPRDSNANLLRLCMSARRSQIILKYCSLGQVRNGWMTRLTATHTIRSKHFCWPRGLPRHHSSTQSGRLHDLGRDTTPPPFMFHFMYVRILP